MSQKKEKFESVYFNDGCVRLKDYACISAKLHSLDPDEYDFSRIFIYKSGQWFHHDLEWNVISVCYNHVEDAVYILSEQGDLNIASKQGFRVEKIPEAGTYEGLGAVNQIRQIGDHLYVCGDQGQVYRRDDEGWQHMDEGLLDRNISASALELNSIDGTSQNDIYAVGNHGRIFHYDGKKWKEGSSPTNCHLERVRCVSPDEFYFCGKDGVFFKGSKKGFTDYSLGDLGQYLWGLEYFQGKVYLAALEGLYEFDGTEVNPVKTGLEPKIGGYRLDARDGMLWSFGVDDLTCFDGKTWQRIKHPDNE